MQATDRMLIEWELTQLIHRSQHALDHERYDELVALFTEDGTFDRLGQVAEGRKGIAEVYANRHPFVTRHCVSNLLFTRVEEDEAEATMYVTDFVGQPPTNGLPVVFQLTEPVVLAFDDLYRRTASGWLIHQRRASIVMQPAQMAAK